jgi:hypothetical protein
MKISTKIIALTVGGMLLLSIFSCVLYGLLDTETKMVWLFWLIVVSAWTSFFGVLWSLYGVYKFDHIARDTGKRLEKYENLLSPERLEVILPLLNDLAKPENIEKIKIFFKALAKLTVIPKPYDKEKTKEV